MVSGFSRTSRVRLKADTTYKMEREMTNTEILAARGRAIGGNVSAGYRRPVHVVRGAM